MPRLPKAQAVSTALAALDLHSLVGLTVDEARQRVEKIGGVIRAVEDAPTVYVDSSYCANRVTVIASRGTVIRVLTQLS